MIQQAPLISIVGASLLAKASGQSIVLSLMHRFREQARSHKGVLCQAETCSNQVLNAFIATVSARDCNRVSQ